MCWSVEPGMSKVITQPKHECFAPLFNHLGGERKGSELRDKMRESRFKKRSAWTVLRDDVFVDLRSDGVDDFLGCLVVIFHSREHFEIADYQCFQYIVA